MAKKKSIITTLLIFFLLLIGTTALVNGATDDGAEEWNKVLRDSINQPCDNDDDCDGIDNQVDNCPTVDNYNQEDSDGDGIGDACDTDDPPPPPPSNDAPPDADGDGVWDSVDRCPTEGGPAQNQGCPVQETNQEATSNEPNPDPDGDGILGDADRCPDIAGNERNFGCVWYDSDSDGIWDDNDLCKFEDGTERLQGCPRNGDYDEDGVFNVVDLCMIVPGERAYWGCPADVDNDGDGVSNGDDNCPFNVNPDQADLDRDGIGSACDRDETIRDDGCNLQTDSDCDGVPNAADRCPNVTGDPGNEEGCLDVASEMMAEQAQYRSIADDLGTIEILGGDNFFCDYTYSVSIVLEFPGRYRRFGLRAAPVTIDFLNEGGASVNRSTTYSRIRNNNRTRLNFTFELFTREGSENVTFRDPLPASIKVSSLEGSTVRRADFSQVSRNCYAELDLFQAANRQGAFEDTTVDGVLEESDGITVSGWGNIFNTQR